MMCPCCEVVSAKVTITTPIGVHSVCMACAVQGANPAYLAAVSEVTWIECMWRLDSSRVKGDGYVAA